jgi:hypothetical protein
MVVLYQVKQLLLHTLALIPSPSREKGARFKVPLPRERDLG